MLIRGNGEIAFTSLGSGNDDECLHLPAENEESNAPPRRPNARGLA